MTAAQRWTAVVKPEVTQRVLALRDREDVVARFWSYVDLGFEGTDCHVWTGALSDEGYGTFALPRDRQRKRVVRAHRIAWLWKHGEIPEDRPFLDHSLECVGRFCVNVQHLDPVDNDENMRRMLLGPMIGNGPQRVRREVELLAREARRAAGEIGIW